MLLKTVIDFESFDFSKYMCLKALKYDFNRGLRSEKHFQSCLGYAH